ncbi:hypothetical protein ABPG72_019427 [Tetrahymena utriculariae]
MKPAVQNNQNIFLGELKDFVRVSQRGASKGDQTEQQTQLLLEQNKKELLDSFFTIKKLQERVHRLELENKSLKDERDEIKNHFDEKKDKYEDMIDLQRTEIDQLKNDKQKAEYEYEKAKKDLEELKEETESILDELKKDFEREKSDLNDKILKLETRLETVDIFIKNKADLENERKNLKEQLEFEKKEKLRELADKDREKVQATDKLKKDMLHKIQETKTSLLALKKEQLQTTTRLTVLQNHQLTTELEYQSKQTEKLLFKNSKLQEQISALKRDVEIHKQVEQELAKRSHFCQKLIKKLSQRIKELEDEAESNKKEKDEERPPEISKAHDAEDRKKDEIINSLERHLKTVEKKLAKVQNDCDILKNENYYLQTKIETSDQKYGNLAAIITTNLENLKNNQQSVYEDILEQEPELNITLDLNEIRHKQVHEWNLKEKEGVLNLLLAQIRPLMSKKNLMQSINTSIANQSINVNIIDDLHQIQQQNNTNQVSLPRINNSVDQKEGSIENSISAGGGVAQINNSTNGGSKKFQDVPLDISTKIVKSPLRDWGKPATTLPSSNNKNQNRRFKVS